MSETPENKPARRDENSFTSAGGDTPKYKLLDDELEIEWKKTLKKIHVRFGADIEMEGIIFLIGVQELGKGYQKFKKDDKLNVMHVAICTLLEPYGYYEFGGTDEDGWPHWKLNEQLPPLKPGHQKALMQQAITEYFSDKL